MEAVSPATPLTLAKITVRTPDVMVELGRRLAAVLGAGDLVLLSGELGAGKTTLARGIGEGLGVRGAVTSPTFVIARVHPPSLPDTGQEGPTSLPDTGQEGPTGAGGPPMVHVDAYRLSGGLDEMEDLDLDVSLPESVVVVEWGEGRVEELSEDRLQVVIERAVGAEYEDGDGDDVREVTLTGYGARWTGPDAPEADIAALAELGG